MSEEQKTITEMTAAEFVKKFHEEIRDTADVQWRDDKEGDFAHKGIAACIGLQWTSDARRNEIRVTDIYEAKRAMEADPKDPLAKAIWRKPRVAKAKAENPNKPKSAKKTKKTLPKKETLETKKPVPTITETKQKVKPLEEVTYEEFDKLRSDLGDEGVFEMYEEDIQDYAEWLWREQEKGESYELDECIEHAKQSLIDGIWGPYSE